MDANVAAMLGYLVGVFAIVNLIAEKDNQFVRFHAVQQIIFTLSATILFFVVFFGFFILTFIIMMVAGAAGMAVGEAGAVIGMIISVITMLIWFVLPFIFLLIIFGGIGLCAYKAYQGEAFKLPVVGRIAAKIFPV